ncbi:MAG: radical SAM family heme chaperone HemW [Clostridia bacterium]|nr:radical SAM family heme chaperone HemW [Clostridia bacterium]
MATDSLGLYVHIPYCVRKCNYCDFCSLPKGAGGVPDDYVDRLCREFLEYSGKAQRPLDTVYFGGGTPSLLSPRQMEKIVESIEEAFKISPSAEITFEANPGTLTREKVNAFYKLGFNRVSLGLQSIHENELKKLGRIHNYEDFLSSYKMLREAGFENISVDLMYGIPYQTKESFAETLRAVIALSPQHISAYGLMVEEDTPFYAERDTLPIPTLDEECDMYGIASQMLAESGFEHYEISNYARRGYRSRHNSLYWNLGEYIGVGAAAHSFFDGVRYSNSDNVDEYLSSRGLNNHGDRESSQDLAYEYAMLRLRLKDGFSLSDYEARFGVSFTVGKEQILERLEREGLLTLTEDRIALTERGFYLSNSILVEIL